jgi:hypothetical protein
MDIILRRCVKVDLYMKEQLKLLIQNDELERRVEDWIQMGDNVEMKIQYLKDFYCSDEMLISLEMILYCDTVIYNQKCSFITNKLDQENRRNNISRWMNLSLFEKRNHISNFNKRETSLPFANEIVDDFKFHDFGFKEKLTWVNDSF